MPAYFQRPENALKRANGEYKYTFMFHKCQTLMLTNVSSLAAREIERVVTMQQRSETS